MGESEKCRSILVLRGEAVETSFKEIDHRLGQVEQRNL